MILRYEHIELRLRHTFTITRGSRDVANNVIVRIDHDGITGIGEAAPSGRYDESPSTVAAFLSKIDLSRFRDPFGLEEILRYVETLGQGNFSAKASVDIALHDWIGKRLGIPLWRYWGLDDRRAPVTSLTIGIDTPETIQQKVHEASSYPILKVKLGTADDRDIIATIRSITKATIRVDANEGWRSREEALDKILWLESQGVEFVEQPMPAGCLEDIAWLRGKVHMPLVADESISTLADIYKVKDAFDGINIKLMKCGGLREALKMIHAAKAAGMKVMLGCMIESSVGISAAAQLSPLADYADLDGNVLIVNDPFDGVRNDRGRLVLTDRAGLGLNS